MYKSQFFLNKYPYDWFCGPGSHMLKQTQHSKNYTEQMKSSFPKRDKRLI